MAKTHKVRSTFILAGLLASLLPIWRDPSFEGGVNAFEYLYLMTAKDRPHIPYEQAVGEAQQAYKEVHGIGFPWMAVGVAAQAPVWRSGGKKNLNFIEFVRNHTIWGDSGPEYVPAEDYKKAFQYEKENQKHA